MSTVSWQGLFKHGIDHYKVERYEDAVECFSKAIATNGNDRKLYDSRASALEKLERYKEALKDAKRVIDLTPTSWQGYARSASLFLRINKPEAALKMADMAIQRVKLSDSKRRSELALLRGLAQTAIANSACHFQKLPVELITVIFSNVIGSSNTTMLRLMTVCRFWRELIIGTPSFWARLTISKKSKQKKVDAWLERSQGRLGILHLTETFDLEARPNTFRHAPTTLWENLQEFHLKRKHVPQFFTVPLPIGVTSSLKLKALHLEVESIVQPGCCEVPAVFDCSMLEELSVRSPAHITPIAFDRYSDLKKLDLTGCCFDLDNLKLLPYPENLERLTLRELHKPFRLFPLDFLVHFTRLTHLELSGFTVVGHWSSLTKLPLLELTFANGVDNLVDDDDCDAIAPLQWRSLRYHYFVMSYVTLASILKKADNLSVLSVIGGHHTMEVGWSVSDATIFDMLAQDDGMACPRLEHFYWCSSTSLKARHAVRIVKARLHQEPDLSNPDVVADSPLPIKTLVIDDCPHVDPETFPWLRANVPMFSCKRRKEEKRRRM